MKFGRELGATLEVYVATFCIFCNFLAFYTATFRTLRSNFSEIYEHNRSMRNDVTRCAESAIYILHIFAYNFGTR